MTFEHALIIVAGALAGGLASGLAGFGTGMMTAGIWLHAVEPLAAAVLTLICSVVAQALTLPSIWRTISPRLVLPFVVPGLLGVPIGHWVFVYVPPLAFKVSVGLLLVLFSTFMLLWRRPAGIAWGGRTADAMVGLLGGVLGGLAGLSGAPPSVWATLRGWSKEQKRSIFQVFNASILATALIAHVIAGHVTASILEAASVALPGTLVGAWLGVSIYRRLSDRNFNTIIVVMLLLSGLTLLASVVPELMAV